MSSQERVGRGGGLVNAAPVSTVDPNGYGAINNDDEIDFSSSVDRDICNEETGLLSGQSQIRPAGSSWYSSVFLVVNAALGAGLLNFPAAFDQCGGILVAVLIQAVLMVFTIGSMVTLVYCSGINQSTTYQDTMLALGGKPTQIICSLAIALYSFGTCITFFVIIGDQWDKFFTFAYGPEFCFQWYMNRKFTIVISSILFILPLSFAKKIDFLKYVSIIGTLAVLYCVLLVTVKYFVGPNSPGPIKTKPDNWTDVFTVVPVICFAYQCHVSVIPIYSCLEKRTVKEFSKTMAAAFAICIFTYTGTAAFGYLTFGSHVNQDILLSYQPTPDVLVAVIVIALKMYTTAPILLFVGRAALDSVYVQMLCLSPELILVGERRRRITMTLIWFATSLLLAVIVPNIGDVISLLGGLAAVFIFVFPGLCLLQLLLKGYIHHQQYKHIYRFLMVSAIFLLVFGMFLFGVTMTQSITADLNPQRKPASTLPCVS